MDLSWARGSGPLPLRAGQGLQGRYGQRPVWCLVRLVRVRDAAEGDVEAEGAELPTWVADLRLTSARRS